MSAFIGPALLRQLVSERACVSFEDTKKVLDAYNELVVSMTESGAKVRVLDRGYFEQIRKKARTITSPMIDKLVKVPAKNKIVYRESRRK